MKKPYNFITELISSNLLSIFIGIIAGVAINVATGQKSLNEDYFYCLLFFVGSTIGLFALTYLRQSMDGEFSIRADVKVSPAQKWALSSRYDEPMIRYSYILMSFTTLGCTAAGVFFLIGGNKIEIRNEQRSNEKLFKEVKLIQSQQQLLLQKISEMYSPQKPPTLQSPIDKNQKINGPTRPRPKRGEKK